MEIEFTDRYQALGIPYPIPSEMYSGDCEGIGWYTTKEKWEWPPNAEPDEIGYVFVKCRVYNGTGKR